MHRYEEADLLLAAEAVRIAIKDEGRSPEYHRYQLQQFTFKWPTLYKTVMHLVEVMDGLEQNGRADQSNHDGYFNPKT